MSYTHVENFHIRTSEINHLKKLNPIALIQLMQEASMQHTIGMKVSVWDMEALKASWVLLKMDVKYIHSPTLGEVVKVETYPSGLDGFFTYRDYFMYDEQGVLCATASSMWTMMNTETRKMVRIPEKFGSLVVEKKENLEKPTQKITLPSVYNIRKTTNVNYFQLDWNGHINNVQLIKMILENLEDDFYFFFTLDQFNIHFKNEAVLGQALEVVCEKVNQNHFLHAILDEETKQTIVLAESFWSKII